MVGPGCKLAISVPLWWDSVWMRSGKKTVFQEWDSRNRMYTWWKTYFIFWSSFRVTQCHCHYILFLKSVTKSCSSSRKKGNQFHYLGNGAFGTRNSSLAFLFFIYLSFWNHNLPRRTSIAKHLKNNLLSFTNSLWI